MQRPISSKTHGFLDYAMAATLITLPFLLSRAKRQGAPTWVAMLTGAAIIPQSLFTDYEWGVKKVYSMRAHLASDIVGALLFGASPWIFGFSGRTKWPFVAAALAELGAVALTDEQAYTRPAAGKLEEVFEQGRRSLERVTPKAAEQTERLREKVGEGV